MAKGSFKWIVDQDIAYSTQTPTSPVIDFNDPYYQGLIQVNPVQVTPEGGGDNVGLDKDKLVVGEVYHYGGAPYGYPMVCLDTTVYIMSNDAWVPAKGDAPVKGHCKFQILDPQKLWETGDPEKSKGTFGVHYAKFPGDFTGLWSQYESKYKEHYAQQVLVKKKMEQANLEAKRIGKVVQALKLEKRPGVKFVGVYENPAPPIPGYIQLVVSEQAMWHYLDKLEGLELDDS